MSSSYDPFSVPKDVMLGARLIALAVGRRREQGLRRRQCSRIIRAQSQLLHQRLQRTRLPVHSQLPAAFSELSCESCHQDLCHACPHRTQQCQGRVRCSCDEHEGMGCHLTAARLAPQSAKLRSASAALTVALLSTQSASAERRSRAASCVSPPASTRAACHRRSSGAEWAERCLTMVTNIAAPPGARDVSMCSVDGRICTSHPVYVLQQTDRHAPRALVPGLPASWRRGCSTPRRRRSPRASRRTGASGPGAACLPLPSPPVLHGSSVVRHAMSRSTSEQAQHEQAGTSCVMCMGLAQG